MSECLLEEVSIIAIAPDKKLTQLLQIVSDALSPARVLDGDDTGTKFPALIWKYSSWDRVCFSAFIYYNLV